MNNGDTPAQPLSTMMDLTDGHIDDGYLTQKGRRFSIGLTKREHFAAMAMQGYIGAMPRNSTIDLDETAYFAVKMANTLLKALEG